MRLAPPLLFLLEAGQNAVATGDLSALPPLLDAALDFHLETQAVFEATTVCLLMGDGGADRIDDVRADFRRQRAALDEMRVGCDGENVHLVQKALHDFEMCTVTLLEDLGRVEAREKLRPQQSALPAIDQFIKVGVNVADGHLPADLLRERLPLLVGTVQLLRADIARFEALYEAPPEIASEAKTALGRMETGVGALITFLREGQREALVDALRLLKGGSATLLEQLARMDAAAREQSRFSRLLAVEETWRALQAFRDGRVPAATVERSAIILHSLGRFYAAQADQAATYPLLFLVRDLYASVQQAMQNLHDTAKPWFERMKGDLAGVAADEPSATHVRKAFELASDALTALQAALEEQARALAGATRLESLVDALGRVAVGAAPAEEGHRQVEEVRAAQDVVLAEIEAAGGGASTEEMQSLLLEQRQAIDEMARFLEDGQEEHLRVGFAVLRQSQPRLLRIQEQTRAVVDAQKQARTRKVNCLHCGASSPWQNRYCTGCNATLPTMSTADETIYTDIYGAEAPQTMPAHLQRIHDLYQEAESGGDLRAIQAELQQLHDKLDRTALEYDQLQGPHVAQQQDERLQEFGRVFRGNLGQMIEGLEVMISGAQSAHIDIMGRGLELTMAAGEEMRQAQQELGQLLAGAQGG